MLKVVDVSYGGENGFNQAIELSGSWDVLVCFSVCNSHFFASCFLFFSGGSRKREIYSREAAYWFEILFHVSHDAGKYFDEISQDTGRFCFGVEDTMKALDMGAVETLILWENLDVSRFTLKERDSEETIVR